MKMQKIVRGSVDNRSYSAECPVAHPFPCPTSCIQPGTTCPTDCSCTTCSEDLPTCLCGSSYGSCTRGIYSAYPDDTTESCTTGGKSGTREVRKWSCKPKDNVCATTDGDCEDPGSCQVTTLPACDCDNSSNGECFEGSGSPGSGNDCTGTDDCSRSTASTCKIYDCGSSVDGCDHGTHSEVEDEYCPGSTTLVKTYKWNCGTLPYFVLTRPPRDNFRFRTRKENNHHPRLYTCYPCSKKGDTWHRYTAVT